MDGYIFRLGKKRIYFIMLVFQFIGGTANAFVPSFQLFCLCRLVVAISIPVLALFPLTLTMEFLSHTRQKHLLLLFTGLQTTLGGALLILISYLIRDWRHLSLAISIPFILYLLTWW